MKFAGLLTLCIVVLQIAKAQDNVRMLSLVNGVRAQRSMQLVCINSKLTNSAQRHADVLASTTTALDHYETGTSTPMSRASAAGFDATETAENLDLGNDVDVTFCRLMKSPVHEQNILDPQMRFMGFAKSSIAGPDSYFRYVQQFASSGTENCDFDPSTIPPITIDCASVLGGSPQPTVGAGIYQTFPVDGNQSQTSKAAPIASNETTPVSSSMPVENIVRTLSQPEIATEPVASIPDSEQNDAYRGGRQIYVKQMTDNTASCGNNYFLDVQLDDGSVTRYESRSVGGSITLITCRYLPNTQPVCTQRVALSKK
jgi:hypothetical protein